MCEKILIEVLLIGLFGGCAIERWAHSKPIKVNTAI